MALKIGLALWSLGLTPTLDKLKEKLKIAREIGVKSVQPWCVDIEIERSTPTRPCVLDPDRCVGADRSAIRELIHSYGLEISGFCAQLMGPTTPGEGWSGSALGDPRGLEERVEKTKKSVKLAVDFDAPIVTTHPGEIPADKTTLKYGTMKKSCTEIALYSEEVGGVFCIETGQEPASTLCSFLEDIGSEALMVNYDPANMLRHGTVEGVKILAPWIVHAHAKDHNPETHSATVGEGLVPWDEYIAAMRAIGYNGWHTLEDETGLINRSIDVVASLRRGRAFLERY